jgi:hypothetical protein
MYGRIFTAVAFLAGSTGFAMAQPMQVLKQEPGPGQLQRGQVALVDDGTCPKGQIKQVTGGGNMGTNMGAVQGGGGRQKACVKRP